LKKIKNILFKNVNTVLISLSSIFICNAQTLKRVKPQSDSYITVEAEDFENQTATTKREWKIVSKNNIPKTRRDPDKEHLQGSSNSKYLELLPDSLYGDNEKKIEGKNYSKTPGKVAILSYTANFKTEGKYYVWVRGFSTGGDDNSIHVGIDGNWPESGKQLYLCEELRDKWSWSSSKFGNTEKCGTTKRVFINITKPGRHEVMFSMREDGFEFDKWAMTKSPGKKPK